MMEKFIEAPPQVPDNYGEGLEKAKVIKNGWDDVNLFKKEMLESEKKLVEKIHSIVKTKYNISPGIEKTIFDSIDLQLATVFKAWGSLKNVAGKRILDLGCGAVGGEENRWFREKAGESGREHEPWFCRALKELGAEPVGVDIGYLGDEKFEHYQLDLAKPGTLDQFSDRSFDGISSITFVGSIILGERIEDELDPDGEIRKKVGKAFDKDVYTKFKNDKIDANNTMVRELEKQSARLLKSDGKILLFPDIEAPYIYSE